MSSAARRRALYAVLLALFVLRIDLWLWDDSGRVLGLPVGLAYHVSYCVAVTLVMSLLVRHAWPRGLGAESGDAAPADP